MHLQHSTQAHKGFQVAGGSACWGCQHAFREVCYSREDHAGLQGETTPVHHRLGSFLLGYANAGTCGLSICLHIQDTAKRWRDAYAMAIHDITIYTQAPGRCCQGDDDQKMVQHHRKVREQGSRIS